MPTCVVLGCHSGSGREEKKYQLETFPKSEEFKQKWIEKINRKDFEPSFNSRICFKHFRKSDFISCDDNKDKQGRLRKLKKLKPTAIPSRYLSYEPSEAYSDQGNLLRGIYNKTVKR